MTPAYVAELLKIKAAGHANFEEYVDEWLRAAEALKAVKALEIGMRNALAEAVRGHVGDALTEGANRLPLADGRTLVLTHKLNRSVDETQIALARSEYVLLNDRPVEFDELLKVKHELVVSAFRKLEEGTPAAVAVSRMIVSKPATPAVEVR